MAYKDSEQGKERRKTIRQANLERFKKYTATYKSLHDKELTEYKRLHHVKRLYGLDADDYLKMILAQNNKCAICSQVETTKNKSGDVRPLCVDHCHKTNKVRALLCNQCNAMLGNAHDDADRLIAAAQYLKAWGG